MGRELLGEAATYTPQMHRLTDIADLLMTGNYIAARAAGAKAKQPKPIKRPSIPADI